MESIGDFTDCVTSCFQTENSTEDSTISMMTSRLLAELMDVYERERQANETIATLHERLSRIEQENEQMKQTLSYAASRLKSRS